MEIQIHPLLYESILVIGAKRTMLRNEKDNLNTLVVGSSHGDFGFDPNYFPGSFNLCSRSQDLKHSFLLYKHITENYPKIKNLILFYSVFSPGSVIERSPSEKFVSPAMNEMFNLDFEYEDEELKAEYEKIRGKLNDVAVEVPGTRGFFPRDFKAFLPNIRDGAFIRANDHMKFNKIEEANHYLSHALLLAKDLGHRVCIAVPPVRSDYKKAVGKGFTELYKSLLSVLNDSDLDKPVGLVNGFDSDLFSDDHFGDYDHLLPLGRGAAHLSKQIYEKINEMRSLGSS